MKKQGAVVRWDDAKGFGFISSLQSNGQLFFHIRDWRGSAAPTVNQRVHYEEIHVGGKGPRAMDVRPDGAEPSQRANSAPKRHTDQRGQDRPRTTGRPPARSRPPANSSPSVAVWLLLTVWLGLLIWGASNGRFAWMLLPAIGALNAVTFLAYWQDKSAAQSNAWRTPENTLHMLSLAGGWPAARLAQQTLRHKSSKASFLVVYGITAFSNTAALAAWVFKLLPQM